MGSQLGLYHSRPYRPPAVVSKDGLEPGGVRRGNHFFQGTDATVKDSFAPLGPPFLPWENRMGRGQTTTTHRQTSRLIDLIGPVGQFSKNTNTVWF